MDSNLSIKVVDFGFAKHFDPKKGLNELLGTPLYMAPELINKQSYDQKVDIWALGVITYVLLCGKQPFPAKTREELFTKIKKATLEFKEPVWAKVSKEAKSFIKKCIALKPKDRPAADILLKDTWITMNANEESASKEDLSEALKHLEDFKNKNEFQKGIASMLTFINNTNSELQQMSKLFKQMDKSKDGKLSKEEVKTGLKTVKGTGKNSAEELDNLVAHMDTDGSGFVSYSEFLASTANKATLFNEENLKRAFNTIDTVQSFI
jgi:calcium-dependent protein kinase